MLLDTRGSTSTRPSFPDRAPFGSGTGASAPIAASSAIQLLPTCPTLGSDPPAKPVSNFSCAAVHGSGWTAIGGAPVGQAMPPAARAGRSEEHTYELQSLMRHSYAVFCMKKQKSQYTQHE